MLMARIILVMLVPSAATSAMESRILGIARNTSMMRIMTLSNCLLP